MAFEQTDHFFVKGRNWVGKKWSLQCQSSVLKQKRKDLHDLWVIMTQSSVGDIETTLK